MKEKKKKTTETPVKGQAGPLKFMKDIVKIAAVIFLITILYTVGIDIDVSAQSTENTQTGEITVRLLEETGENAEEGVMILCTKVAEIENGEYVLTERFRGSGVDLNTVEDSEDLRNAAEKLAEYAEGKAGTETQTQATDQNGEVKFTGIPVGVYMIRGTADSSWDLIVPSLVSIPSFDEDNGEMVYSVLVEPKHVPREETGENIAPQTGLEDASFQYFAGGILCVSGAMLLILTGIRKKSHEK